MASADVCPVVGTTNSVLPPTHPSVDLSKDGQKCPVTNATTDHHHNLQVHPPVPGASADATQCPVLQNTVESPVAKKTDEGVCPVVGTATTVLPPDHPKVEGKENVECPVTKAKASHHQGVLLSHPSVNGSDASQCPVVGAKA